MRSRSFLVWSLLFVVLPAGTAPAAWTSVGTGIDYQNFSISGPNEVFVTRMDLDNTNAFIESSIGQGRSSGGTETVRNQASRYDDAIGYWGQAWGTRNDVVVAINGSYYNTTTGVPYSGIVHSGSYDKRYDNVSGQSGFMWDLNRNATIGLCVTHTANKQFVTYDDSSTQNFKGINVAPADGELTIFTPQYDDSTGTSSSVSEVVVQMSTPFLIKPSPNYVSGTVVEIRQNQGDASIPFDCIVLSALGSAETTMLGKVSLNDTIKISQEIKHYMADCSTSRSGIDWTKAYAGVSGNWVFLRDSVIQTGIDSSGARHPRTAIGFNDDYVFFLVVDGRQSGYSIGMTIDELASFFKNTLSATWACNQDGGGSSTMVVNGVVKNDPSDGSERSVSNGMLMCNVVSKSTSTTFSTDEDVETTGTANVRLGPGTNYATLTSVSSGEDGTIMSHSLNGVYAKSYYWWKVDFGSTEGWVAETLLDSTAPSGPTITSQPSAQNVCAGSTANFSVTATGSGTLTYQWQLDSTNISGATSSTLQVTSVDSGDVGDYRCVVTDNNGSTNSNTAALTLKTATSITSHPSNETVTEGQTAQFTVSAAGSGTLTYQWQKGTTNLSNGGDISGATSTTLSIANAEDADEGNYRCVVTGDCGSVNSNYASLTVNASSGGTTLVDDDFDDYANQTAFEAVWSDIYGTVTLSSSAYYSSPNSVYIGTGGARCGRDFTSTSATDSTPLTVSFRYYDNSGYNNDRQYIQFIAHNASDTMTQLMALGTYNSLSAMHDYYSARVAFSPGPGWFVLNDTGAPERSIGWHELKAVFGSTTVDFYVDGTLAKEDVSYSSSEGDHDFDEIRIGSGYSSLSSAYYDDMLIASGSGGSSGPSITAQPSAQNICAGSTANFSVTATGEGTLTYQWQVDSSNISGATSSTLQLTNVDSGDEGDYRCVVTDDDGSTNSNTAALTLKAETTITADPSNETVTAGQTAQFSVTATGSGTLTYQWQKDTTNLSNGGDISGATSATLSIANAEDADEDDYRCVVTGDCGSDTSSYGTLTVNPASSSDIIDDDFDSYANQTAFAAVWSDVYGTVTLSTSAYYSSPNSVYIGTAAGRRGQDFDDVYGTNSNPLELSFRYYDNSAYNLDRQRVQLYAHNTSDTLTQLICLGTDNSDYDMRDYYAARVPYSPGPGWVVLDDTGAPERSIGWHELEAVIKSTTIDFYVDGTLAKSGVSYSSSEGAHTFDEIRIGSGYSSTSAAYYDDVLLSGGE